jgi:hypothetical protein
LFAVAPLDVLVTENAKRRQFHVIEINGTGIGGLTNMPGTAVGSVLENLCEWAERMPEPDALVLVASSGKENDRSPRINRLIHEKILYAEALKRGFEFSGRPANVVTMAELMTDAGALREGRATIVLGYMKEFLTKLELDDDGKLHLLGRRVHAAVNDRFCLNVLHQFDRDVDLESFQTMNRGFLAGADKGVAYALLNKFLAKSPRACLPAHVNHERVFNRDELIAAVLAWVRRGRRTVIKPQGTGLGHGIEFFLNGSQDEESIIAQIDSSLRLTEEHYRLKGGAFPYTVCEYLDARTIENPNHPLHGHKFELRIVVYRDGMRLKAFPAIAKVASESYDPANPAYLSLINNITASSQAKKTAGVEHMLPLANRDTLALLGIPASELKELCTVATTFMRFVLDQVEDEPAVFGLPAKHRLRFAARR